MKYENHADEWREEDRKSPRQPYYDPRDPRYSPPEWYCPTCEDYTTQIDRFGCCRECGTEVRDSPEEQEPTYPRWWEELQDVGMSQRDFI